MIFKNQLHVLIELLAVHGKLKGIVPTCSHEVEFVLANRILAVAPIKIFLREIGDPSYKGGNPRTYSPKASSLRRINDAPRALGHGGGYDHS